MAIPVAKRLISAMAVFMLMSASFATTEVPFMVVHKKASINRLKSGAEHVLVSIDIYNQGFSSAYDVSLTDSSWDKDRFQVVSGNTSRSWKDLMLEVFCLILSNWRPRLRELSTVHLLLLLSASPPRLLYRKPTLLRYYL